MAPSRRRVVLDACDELAERIPELRPIVAEAGPATLRKFKPRHDHFGELCRSILYQQLAGKAARTIHGRFLDLFDGEPTPEAVLAIGDGPMRAAGLSGNKERAIRDLAAKVIDGTLELDRVSRLPDEKLIEELVAVRGIGRWTAEMFLMFQLGRLDVWPVDDLGVRKGYGHIFGLPLSPTPKELAPLGEQFRPYRSIVAWYCWAAADTVLPVAPT
ncbi:MAG: DNA-3-methyladenine glycosylase [Actinomycetia bacterium]|nr:DNA-3-methyladenine glycosylase [Actinomycetes bacterium]